MSAQIVPLTNAPNQSLIASLNINGQALDRKLTLRYNELAGYWVLTIADSAGNVVLDSIPLVGGVDPAGNLLTQFGYLAIGGITVINLGSARDYPDAQSLGTGHILIWYDNA